MTKNVLVSIVGMHYGVDDESGDSEPLEVITPATYYFKNNKHYILYEEVLEGTTDITKTNKENFNHFLLRFRFQYFF